MNESIDYTKNTKSQQKSKIKKGLSLSIQKKRKISFNTQNDMKYNKNSTSIMSNKKVTTNNEQVIDKQNQQNRKIPFRNHSNSNKKNRIKYVEAYNSFNFIQEHQNKVNNNKNQRFFKIVDQDIKLGGSKPKSNKLSFHVGSSRVQMNQPKRKLSLNTNINTQSAVTGLMPFNYDNKNKDSNLTNMSYMNNTISFGRRKSIENPTTQLIMNRNPLQIQRKILRQSKVSKVSTNLLQENLEYFKQINTNKIDESTKKYASNVENTENKTREYNFNYNYNDFGISNNRFMISQQIKREPFTQINLNKLQKNNAVKSTTINHNNMLKSQKRFTQIQQFLSLPNQCPLQITKSKLLQMKPLPLPDFQIQNLKQNKKPQQSSQLRSQSGRIKQQSFSQNIVKPLMQKLEQNPQKRLKNSTIKKLQEVQNQLDEILKQAYEARNHILTTKS